MWLAWKKVSLWQNNALNETNGLEINFIRSQSCECACLFWVQFNPFAHSPSDAVFLEQMEEWTDKQPRTPLSMRFTKAYWITKDERKYPAFSQCILCKCFDISNCIANSNADKLSMRVWLSHEPHQINKNIKLFSHMSIRSMEQISNSQNQIEMTSEKKFKSKENDRNDCKWEGKGLSDNSATTVDTNWLVDWHKRIQAITVTHTQSTRTCQQRRRTPETLLIYKFIAFREPKCQSRY